MTGSGEEHAKADEQEATLLKGETDPVDRAVVIAEGIRTTSDYAWRMLVIAAAAAGIGWALSQVSDAVIPLVLALLLASVLWPLTAWLKRAGIPYAGGAAISLLMGFGGIAALIGIVAPSVVGQWGQLSEKTVEGIRQVQDWAAGPPLNIQDGQLNNWIAQGIDFLQGHSADIAGQALSFGGSLGNGVVTLLLTLVLTFFFLKDGPRFLGWVAGIVGKRAGFHTTELLTRVWNTISGYIRTQALVSFVDAVFIGIGMALLGVPLAFPIAVVTFMAGFIPIVGAVTAGAVAVLVALVSNGLTTAALVLLIVLLVQQIEGNVLQPLLQSRVMQLHPIVVLLAVVLGGSWFGIIGAFLAVPVAATGAVVLRYLGDLTDLRTGDRTSDEVAWATSEGQVAATDTEQRGALFRSMLHRAKPETSDTSKEERPGKGTKGLRRSWRSRSRKP